MFAADRCCLDDVGIGCLLIWNSVFPAAGSSCSRTTTSVYHFSRFGSSCRRDLHGLLLTRPTEVSVLLIILLLLFKRSSFAQAILLVIVVVVVTLTFVHV